MKSIFILIETVISLYIWIVIINVVLTWLVAFNILNTTNRFVYSILEASHRLTSPALQYIRKFIPVFSGIDISPVILIILLMFLRNMIFELFAPGLF